VQEGRRFLIFAVAVSIAAAPGVAHAFSTSRLEYSLGPGAEACPAELEVRANVADRLGYDPFVESASRTIVVRISRVDENLKATVELVDPRGSRQGRREFSAGADRCGELVSALALSISIAVDPERAQRTAESEEAAPSVPATRPIEHREPSPRPLPPTRDAAPEPPLERPPPRALGWQFGAGGHAAIGSAPSATGGAFAFFGARLASASLSLEGRADFPASTTVAGGAEVSASLLLLSAVPCWEGARLFACALLTAGSLQGSGARITSPGDDAGFYAAAGARLGTTIELYDPLSLRMSFDFLKTLTLPTLDIDGQAVWKVPPFSGAGGLGLLARFP